MNLTPEQLAKTSPDHPIHQVMERLRLVEEKMQKADPEIGTHLKEIHKHLRQYEELAHLLTPEQIGVFMRGMQKYTAIVLVTEDQGKKKSSSRSKKPTVDDLI